MIPMKKLGFYIAKIWAYGLAITPFWLLYLRSDVYYFLVYHVAHYRRKVVRQNLANAFPEKDAKELKRIEKAFYRNLCDLVVEACKLLVMKPDELKKHVYSKNPEVFQEMYEKNKGVFVAVPHSSNWEWMGNIVPLLSEHKLLAIYKKMKNKDFEDFICKMRVASNPTREEMVEASSILKYLLLNKDKIFTVYIVADQSPMGLKTDYWTEFLHQDTCWFTGVEKMSKLLDYAVVYAAMKRVKRGYYEVEYTLICENPKEMPNGQIVEGYVRCLERFIHENPDNWLWSHRRWKRKREDVEKNG